MTAGTGGAYCIFFEVVSAKKVRTDPRTLLKAAKLEGHIAGFEELNIKIIFFWLYQALPGFTRLDRQNRTGR